MTATDEDGAIVRGTTLTSRWVACRRCRVRVGCPAPPWGEGEDDAVLLQRFPLRQRQRTTERMRKVTTATAKTAATEATEMTRTHSRHVNITKHII